MPKANDLLITRIKQILADKSERQGFSQSTKAFSVTVEDGAWLIEARSDLQEDAQDLAGIICGHMQEELLGQVPAETHRNISQEGPVGSFDGYGFTVDKDFLNNELLDQIYGKPGRALAGAA